MARAFTADQKALLQAPAIKARLLVTFFLDEGTYRFCDDVVDLYNGVNTYIGASALLGAVDVKSGQDLAAEPVTLVVDGLRMTEAGIPDPAQVLVDMMGYLHQQRRVDFAWGFMYPDQKDIILTIPIAAVKINHCRIVHTKARIEDPDQPIPAVLEITLDALAMRYGRATHRTRSHADQQEIDPTDMFFSFAQNTVDTEKSLYWGRANPAGGGNLGGAAGDPGYYGSGGYGGGIGGGISPRGMSER